MKKSLMILASVALGASMVVGQDVESKNVVGFSTSSFPSNLYTALGWQFAIVGGQSNIPIASITNYPNQTKALTFGGSDMIRRFNSATSTYTDYFNRTSGWRKVGETTNTADTISVGEMVMFLKRVTNSDFAQSGEVLGIDVTINTPANQYTSMCNPFPEVFSIAAFTNYPNPTRALTFGGSDMIRRFNSASSTYTDYFNRTSGWRKVGETTNTADVINIGEGFMFLKRNTSSLVSFTTPIQ